MYNSQLENIVTTNHVKYMHADVSECVCVSAHGCACVYINSQKVLTESRCGDAKI